MPKRISKMPTKYIRGPTQASSAKNAPTKRAITGSFAPHGMNGVSIAVIISLFNRAFISFYGYARPVADLFVSACQCIVHVVLPLFGLPVNATLIIVHL